MHREEHRRISLQQRAKKGMNVYATTQLEFKEGFFSGVPKKSQPPTSNIPDREETQS